MWVLMVTHTSSDELLQYANERQDQAVMGSTVLLHSASGSTPTDRPQSIHWMHIEHKNDTPYIFRYFTIPITCRSDGLILSQVGCSWTEKAAI